MALTKKQKDRKKKLTEGIRNNTQTMWIWGVLGVLFIWTIVVPIISLIGILAAYEMKTKKKVELIDLE